jgi:hypothetical protein
MCACVQSKSGEARSYGWSSASKASCSAKRWPPRARSCSPKPASWVRRDSVEARRQPISERDEPLAQVEEPGVYAGLRATESVSTHWLMFARRVSLRRRQDRLRALRSSGTLRLIERFGADAAGPDVLMELAQCERRKDFSRPCGARYTDLAGPLVSEFGRSVPCHPPEQLRPERLWNGAVTVIGR